MTLEILGVHPCLPAVVGRPAPRVNQLQDLATLAFRPRLDLARLLGVAGTWQADVVVAYAVGAACTDLDLPVHASALGILRELPTLGDTLRYARALTFPRQPGLSGAHRLTRAMRALGSR